MIDPAAVRRDKIFFGATVTIEDEEGITMTYQIVGEDEVDPKAGKISWASPFGKALLGRCIDDEVVVKRPAGNKVYIVIAIS